ncbi:MAG: hypothetical protein AB1540_10600 [Bdellovibrionota bacterium]
MTLNQSSREAFLKLGLVFVSSLLLFSTLNDSSMWIDEVATVVMSDPRWGLGYSDAQMPLVYLMVWLSKLLLGAREFTFRFPVALCAFAFILVLPKYFAEHGLNRIAAYLAPLVLLLSPEFLFYAQEARAYVPMVVLLFLWGYCRDKFSGFKLWLLCTAALQANTFSILYVVMVLAVDWIGLRRNAKGMSQWKASALAVLTHLPSLGYIAWAVKTSRFPVVKSAESNLWADVLQKALSFEFLEYLKRAWTAFAPENILGWVVLTVASAVGVALSRPSTRRYWIGIALALVVHAYILVPTGWVLYTRYLLMLLLLCSVPALSIRLNSFSVGMAWVLFMILIAHASLKPRFEMLRNEAGQWQGIVSSLFPATARALTVSSRENWRDLGLFLNRFAKDSDLVGMQACVKCSPYTLDYYIRRSANFKLLRIEDNPKTCPDWVVSTFREVEMASKCKKEWIWEFGGLHLYGSSNVHGGG